MTQPLDERIDEILAVYGGALLRGAEASYNLAISHVPIKPSSVDAILSNTVRSKENAKAAIKALLVEARLDELGRAAPHQVALYFEINTSELNSHWYLAYCKDRRVLLQPKDTNNERTGDA